VQKAEKAAKAASPPGNSLLKRKRSDVDESDPKLKEFLEVMRPKSTSKTWDTRDSQEQDAGEPPRKVQAVELPEAESDSEYEMVPKKSKKQYTPVQTAPSLALALTDEVEPSVAEQAEPQNAQPELIDGLEATDDDEWLRSRTNRLLDLVDPTDVVAQSAPVEDTRPSIIPDEHATSAELDVPGDRESGDDKVIENDASQDKPDPTLEAIRTSSRLFVRNLPYTATEDDLRRHFQPYGTLEEVTKFRQCAFCFMMNIQIGTSYASKYMMRTGRKF
jgi:multiple RNA-binding domain-containing protein 1